MNIYTRNQLAAMAFAAGLLTGMITAFAACSPPAEPTGYSVGTQR
jgi:hypothetical protein